MSAYIRIYVVIFSHITMENAHLYIIIHLCISLRSLKIIAMPLVTCDGMTVLL